MKNVDYIIKCTPKPYRRPTVKQAWCQGANLNLRQAQGLDIWPPYEGRALFTKQAQQRAGISEVLNTTNRNLTPSEGLPQSCFWNFQIYNWWPAAYVNLPSWPLILFSLAGEQGLLQYWSLTLRLVSLWEGRDQGDICKCPFASLKARYPLPAEF